MVSAARNFWGLRRRSGSRHTRSFLRRRSCSRAKEYKFDPFNLSAALAARDKKGLWLGLYQALRAGEKPEAVAGLLAWKARSIGDKKLSRELTFLYHDSHRGAGDLELLLERFALKL
ncbi:MAG: hypothetical protein UY83_C0008G0024 [Candidatus Adlerbacteria bacterium GW2011_GWA1_54_10]|uniref:Uncharacterized protein n=1 Tax=Candidatus Adlerbacteria bacterium GW2011_GWA1_54_10 TaxID=1618605 RepID=A0A0G1XWS3_9BACT|nr:MAG: hypothetical protein UY83_C0008G0024 [Candidatus Adlerbacteria bacterium GW2011_GWA1_54_10]